jgi:hypothetical protein
MRSLTDNEARVLASLLGADATERERLLRLGIPRSTYHAIRRRAYAEGWLRDRYVPAPSLLSRSFVTFGLARPFADRVEETDRAWGAHPGNVLLWSAPQLSLAVYFHESEDEAERTQAALRDPAMSRWSFAITCDAREATVPVYFDFEGAWNNLTGGPGTVAYPRGLVSGAPTGSHRREGPLSARDRWAVGALLERPFQADSQGRPGHLLGPLGLPWAQRRLIESGRVVHRVLADPSRIPPYKGQLADRVVFVTGTMAPGAPAARLFAELTRNCRVFPFLYATDGARLLMAALAGGAPAAVRPRDERASVIGTLRGSVRDIEILEESASAIGARVDHRYDRLVPGAPSGERAPVASVAAGSSESRAGG